MPLVLPSEAGVDVGNLNMPDNANGRVTQGYGNNSLGKGKGKQLERSKSFV